MTLSFEISAKEHHVIGTVQMKYDKINTNIEDSSFHLIFSPILLRYECPAGCLDATGKVVGTVYYEMVSTQF